jgi:hypothetical protein
MKDYIAYARFTFIHDQLPIFKNCRSRCDTTKAQISIFTKTPETYGDNYFLVENGLDDLYHFQMNEGEIHNLLDLISRKKIGVKLEKTPFGSAL